MPVRHLAKPVDCRLSHAHVSTQTIFKSQQERRGKMKGGKRNTEGVKKPFKNEECLELLACQMLGVKTQVHKIVLDDGENYNSAYIFRYGTS